MKRLKLYIIFNLIWFFVLYNLERLIAPINIASFVYVLVAGYAFFVVLFPPLQRIPFTWVFLASLIPYIGLKIAFQSPIAGLNLPLTITEVVSLSITLYLARQTGRYLNVLGKEILQLTIGPARASARHFQTAQADCYREIRRARHYNRPAAVLSIAPSKESVDLSISRFLQEAQNSLIRQYIVARTVDLLRKDLKESDIVMMRNNHFLVLLPETEQKHVDTIANRLQNSASERLGLHLQIGASTFPDEAITFESLVEHAEKRMKQSEPKQAGSTLQKQSADDTVAELAVAQPGTE